MDHKDLSRLRWRCTRRAMLEMDLLMGRFLEEAFPGLSPENQQAFVKIADCEDMQLWPWINGQAQCEDASLQPVVGLLQKFCLDKKP